MRCYPAWCERKPYVQRQCWHRCPFLSYIHDTAWHGFRCVHIGESDVDHRWDARRCCTAVCENFCKLWSGRTRAHDVSLAPNRNRQRVRRDCPRCARVRDGRASQTFPSVAIYHRVARIWWKLAVSRTCCPYPSRSFPPSPPSYRGHYLYVAPTTVFPLTIPSAIACSRCRLLRSCQPAGDDLVPAEDVGLLLRWSRGCAWKVLRGRERATGKRGLR